MGAGLMRLSGDGFNSFTRGIVVPVSVTFGPFEHTNGLLKPVRLVFEEAYIFRGFNGADFGNTVTTFDTHGGEWRPSFKIAYDFPSPAAVARRFVRSAKASAERAGVGARRL